MVSSRWHYTVEVGSYSSFRSSFSRWLVLIHNRRCCISLFSFRFFGLFAHLPFSIRQNIYSNRFYLTSVLLFAHSVQFSQLHVSGLQYFVGCGLLFAASMKCAIRARCPWPDYFRMNADDKNAMAKYTIDSFEYNNDVRCTRTLGMIIMCDGVPIV